VQEAHRGDGEGRLVDGEGEGEAGEASGAPAGGWAAYAMRGTGFTALADEDVRTDLQVWRRTNHRVTSVTSAGAGEAAS
jgi:hypothetical protein